MNARVKAVRIALGLSQDEFGKRLGLTRGAITNIELNKVDVKANFAELLCSVFNVNSEWLHNGEGEMFIQPSRNDEIAAYVGRVLKDENSAFQQKMLLFFSRLSPEALAELERVADEILGE